MKVTLKLATSLDGRIATRSGESKWITGPDARAQVHRLRADHQAISVGIGTVLADDPELTVRGVDGAVSPHRVILDSQLRTPVAARVLNNDGAGCTIVSSDQASDEKKEELRAAGANVLSLDRVDETGRLSVSDVVHALSDRGFETLFVEGGSAVAASFLRAGLVTHLEWFRAPKLIGGDGLPALGPLGVDALSDAFLFRPVALERCGDDIWERFVRKD